MHLNFRLFFFGYRVTRYLTPPPSAQLMRIIIKRGRAKYRVTQYLAPGLFDQEFIFHFISEKFIFLYKKWFKYKVMPILL